MTVSFANLCKRLVFNVLAIFFCSHLQLYSQAELSGNLSDDYPSASVLAIGSDRITVDDITGFKANDTILIIQMQGVGIITADISYGMYQKQFGKPGMHEFLIIDQVNLPDEIVFKNNILNGYDVIGKVQIIRVPYFNSARVTGTLTVNPWDNAAGKGGVLALIVGSTLTLDADIDVSGLGLKGGAAVAGTGECSILGTLNNTYPDSFDNAGYKGEGIAVHDMDGNLLFPDHAKGEGPNYTGGGGGNGKYSGGGGGGNAGFGGRGGYENPECAALYGGSGANGTGSELAGRLFFGGGGGGSTSESGNFGAGGHGGGIVIIITDSLISSGGRILADGSPGATGGTNGGAGGGGAGGTIAISLRNFGNTPLTLSAAGGKGGYNPASFGEGGGGGGGRIYLNTTVTPSVTTLTDGGKHGNYPADDIGGQSGTPGLVDGNFIPVLNGFLFNSIRSTVSGSQSDVICFGMTPPLITGTAPVGGISPYTYTWKKKTNIADWTLIPGVTTPDYQPVVETDPDIDTVYFMRIVNDQSDPALVDYSKEVRITIQPLITGNTVGYDTTICFSQDTKPIESTDILGGGDGSNYYFTWQMSSDGSDFDPAPGNYTEEFYTGTALQSDTWFRRVVNSGKCVDQGNIIFVDVLPSIDNNVIVDVPDICSGMEFQELLGSGTVTGGSGIYKYMWEYYNSASWEPAAGINNLDTYDPVELPQGNPYNEYILRRIVLSGNYDVCSSISNIVTLRDYHVIENNTIAADQVICSGTTPDRITGSVPVFGDGIYTYTWEKSNDLSGSWSQITGLVNSDSVSYQPQALTDTTWFRRLVQSSACSSISDPVMVIVHDPVINNEIMLLSGTDDTTICQGQIPNLLTGLAPLGGTNTDGDYQFQWLLSTTETGSFEPVSPGGTDPFYQPSSLTQTTFFKRKVTSGACEDISASTITVNVLPSITNNSISADQTVCYNTVPSQLSGSISSGGNAIFSYKWYQKSNGGDWTEAAGANNSQSYAPPAMTEHTQYYRVITSGLCCTDTSNIVDIYLHPPLPEGTITNIIDTTICGGSKVLLKVRFEGSGPWDFTYTENSIESEIKSSNTSFLTVEVTPEAPSATNNYNYTLGSVTDTHGCRAVLLTGSKNATVHKVPVADAGPDQSVCGPVVNLAASASVGTGQWTFPGFVLTQEGSAPEVTIAIDSISDGLYNSEGNIKGKFYWEETNWQCRSIDSVEITFFRRPDYINAGADTLLYSVDQFYHLLNDPPRSWETGEWTTISGSGSVNGNTISGLANGPNSFAWKIFNGLTTCYLDDTLNIDVHEIEIPEGFSPNGDVYNNTFAVKGLSLPHQVVELRIVNTAGAEVFRTSNQEGQEWTDWDGKDIKGQDLPDGTYYYFLKIRSLDTEIVDTRRGYIILKRY